MGAQLRCHEPAHAPRQGKAGARIGLELVADTARGRKTGEARPEALHPATLMVDGHDQRGAACAVNLGYEGGQLLRVGVVAGEKDHPPDEGVPQQLALLGLEARALQVDHQGTEANRISPPRAAPGGVSRARDSTWVVCGNMSSTPAARSANPKS